jgi:hypothetical protein
LLIHLKLLAQKEHMMFLLASMAVEHLVKQEHFVLALLVR